MPIPRSDDAAVSQTLPLLVLVFACAALATTVAVVAFPEKDNSAPPPKIELDGSGDVQGGSLKAYRVIAVPPEIGWSTVRLALDGEELPYDDKPSPMKAAFCVRTGDECVPRSEWSPEKTLIGQGQLILVRAPDLEGKTLTLQHVDSSTPSATLTVA